MTVEVKHIEQRDFRLGRHIVHDSDSKSFPTGLTINKSLWHDKAVRIYDPWPNPNQCHGECTFCAKCMQLNAVGNRVLGRVLNMDHAHRGYARETEIDPYAGTFTYDPATHATGGDDTGSNGLASCKVAVEEGLGGEYRWFFRGADEVVEAIMRGWAVSVGTRWDYDMFEPDAEGIIHPGGGSAGGHQYVARRYWKSRDLIGGRCWWGSMRDWWMLRTEWHELLIDDGDAHWQKRIVL